MIFPVLLFTVLGLACVGLVAAGLPGGWALLGLAAVIELLDGFVLGTGSATTFGWWLLALGGGALLVGEALELASGMFGSRTGGGTKRGMTGAVLGGLLGGLAGTFLIPIPVIGTLIGTVGGTFVGAMAGEMTGAERRDWKDALVPAVSATIGRVLGTVAKVGVTTALWVLLTAVLIWG